MEFRHEQLDLECELLICSNTCKVEHGDTNARDRELKSTVFSFSLLICLKNQGAKIGEDTVRLHIEEKKEYRNFS